MGNFSSQHAAGIHLFLRLESSVPLLVYGPKEHEYYLEDVA